MTDGCAAAIAEVVGGVLEWSVAIDVVDFWSVGSWDADC